jgi:hypothetical protein
MDLASASTAGEAYDRVVRAFDAGRLTPAQARVAVELLKVRSTVSRRRSSKRLNWPGDARGRSAGRRS